MFNENHNIQNHFKVFNRHCTKSQYSSFSRQQQNLCINLMLIRISSIKTTSKAIATNIITNIAGKKKVTRNIYQFTINPNTKTKL